MEFSAAPSLDRVISPAFDGVDTRTARAILKMKFSPEDLDRLHTLSEKADQDSLSDDERQQLDLYLQFGHMLTLMHSRARMALKHPAMHRRRKTA